MIQDPISLVPFALLLCAVLGLWIHRAVWLGALLLSIVAAYFTGALQGLAIVWIALLGVLAWVYARTRRAVAGILFFLMALALGLLLLPGFPRTVLVESTTLSPGALAWSIGLGFPKVVAGIFILGLIHDERVHGWRGLAQLLKRVAPVFLVTICAVMAIALALGYVRFDPKWTPLFFVWAPVNLFFTCMSEEAFFRGFVQRELARIAGNRSLAPMLALIVGAVLFGLAHFGGGWKYVVAATVAGLGYGWAYHRTRRVEAAMAVHFGLNALHFLLFTYPALAPTSA